MQLTSKGIFDSILIFCFLDCLTDLGKRNIVIHSERANRHSFNKFHKSNESTLITRYLCIT